MYKGLSGVSVGSVGKKQKLFFCGQNMLRREKEEKINS